LGTSSEYYWSDYENLRPSGYGALAHQRHQNWLACTPSFYGLNNGKGRNTLNPSVEKRGRRAEKLFAVTKFKNLSIFAQVRRLAYLPN